ncbi:MAG: hypothetical protein U5L96_01500 [Owenweeksia sp.]|nr:hypothetical protein [Owenweeksia sp.]
MILNLSIAMFVSFGTYAQAEEEKIPFGIFNRTYTQEDTDAEILIDGYPLFYTSSINNGFNMDTAYYTLLKAGYHVVEVRSFQNQISIADTVLVDSTRDNQTHPVNWLWIDYNFTPAPREQFEFKLNEKINELSGTTSLDSASLWHRARAELLEDKRRIIRDEETRGFVIRWGQVIND